MIRVFKDEDTRLLLGGWVEVSLGWRELSALDRDREWDGSLLYELPWLDGETLTEEELQAASEQAGAYLEKYGHEVSEATKEILTAIRDLDYDDMGVAERRASGWKPSDRIKDLDEDDG